MRGGEGVEERLPLGGGGEERGARKRELERGGEEIVLIQYFFGQVKSVTVALLPTFGLYSISGWLGFPTCWCTPDTVISPIVCDFLTRFDASPPCLVFGMTHETVPHLNLFFHRHPGSSRLGYRNAKCHPYRDPTRSNILFHMADRDFFAPCSGSCMSSMSVHCILRSSYRLSLFSFLQSPFPFITRCSRHLKFPHLNDQYLPSSSPLTPDPTAIIFHAIGCCVPHVPPPPESKTGSRAPST